MELVYYIIWKEQNIFTRIVSLTHFLSCKNYDYFYYCDYENVFIKRP